MDIEDDSEAGENYNIYKRPNGYYKTYIAENV